MQATTQTFDGEITGSKRLAVRFLPGLTDLVFLLPIFLLFGILPGSKVLLGDADMGWHIRTGEWILQHHTVPTHDLFSFTRANAPWYAWEWGWDTLFAAIHGVAGLPGIVAVNIALLGAVAVLTFRLVRRACGNDLIALVVAKVALCGSTVHWLARPHLLSWIFFLAFAHLIARATEGRTRPLFWLPILMVFWTNIHGSFFLGLLMIFIAAAPPWIDCALYGGELGAAWRKSRAFIICGSTSILATFANPYGWHLHEHVVRYLRDSKQMDMMQEFQSMNFHHAPAMFVEIMLVLGAACLFWCAQRREWNGFLTLLLWLHLGLFAVRSVPMFLFLSAPWIGRMLADVFESRSNRITRLVSKIAGNFGSEFGPLEQIERLHLASAVAFLFVAASIAAGRPGFKATFDNKAFPQSALAVIDRYKPERVFARDQWSAYLIYERSPRVKVYVDDRSDFYGAEMFERASHILNGRWDWESDLLRTSTDMVIVAPEAPLATVLKSSPRWQLVLDDKSVVAFARKFPARSDPVIDPEQKGSAVASNGGRKLGA
jgi:hypothetical protein